jgi:OmpA-OmpF porin, OOP family
MKKVILSTIIGASILGSSLLHAQTEDKKWNLGAFIGKSEYNGDLGNGFFNFKKASYNFGALSVSRYLTKGFDLSLYGSYGEHGFYKNFTDRLKCRNTYGDLTLRYKIIQKAEAKLIPFIFAGIGFRNLDAVKNGTSATYRVNSGMDLVIPAGLGLDYRFSKSLSARYFSTFGYTLGDKRDYIESGSNDMQLQHNIGLTFSFGGKKDTDKDGVADKFDKCPDTPLDTPVDADGCTLDMDKDGIADHLDECPEVKGLSAFKGCPDSDNDGIKDSEDTCPLVAGKSEFKGCPDSDNDGVEDSKDKCPTVFGLAQFDGCPDSDGDGIVDSEDACPQIKGTVAFAGCPDTDGDGIADNKDKCPTVAGLKELNGCPEVKINTKAKEIFQRAMAGIQFETGKDIIKKTSYPILDNVVGVLKENTDWNVEVQGHTDNVGAYEANKTLSEKRAKAVQNYLITKGISPNKLSSSGYGSDKPIADNKTTAGKAQNRRVEFKVTYEK